MASAAEYFGTTRAMARADFRAAIAYVPQAEEVDWVTRTTGVTEFATLGMLVTSDPVFQKKGLYRKR